MDRLERTEAAANLFENLTGLSTGNIQIKGKIRRKKISS